VDLGPQAVRNGHAGDGTRRDVAGIEDPQRVPEVRDARLLIHESSTATLIPGCEDGNVLPARSNSDRAAERAPAAACR